MTLVAIGKILLGIGLLGVFLYAVALLGEDFKKEEYHD